MIPIWTRWRARQRAWNDLRISAGTLLALKQFRQGIDVEKEFPNAGEFPQFAASFRDALATAEWAMRDALLRLGTPVPDPASTAIRTGAASINFVRRRRGEAPIGLVSETGGMDLSEQPQRPQASA